MDSVSFCPRLGYTFSLVWLREGDWSVLGLEKRSTTSIWLYSPHIDIQRARFEYSQPAGALNWPY